MHDPLPVTAGTPQLQSRLSGGRIRAVMERSALSDSQRWATKPLVAYEALPKRVLTIDRRSMEDGTLTRGTSSPSSGSASSEQQLRHFAQSTLPHVRGALRFVTTDEDQIEDALAEALARTWVQLEQGRRIESLEAWVYVVARNEIRREGKRRTRERRWLTTTVHESAALDEPDLGGEGRTLQAVRALPSRQRDAIVLHYWFDQSIRDVAATLRVAEGTVKALLHQGRKAIRSSLTTEGNP